MLRVIVIVLGLVAISLTYTLKSPTKVDKEAIEVEDYSWDEAKGYEECTEFMNKDWQQEGDLDDEKNDWESNDFDDDEGNEDEQYRFDSDEDDDGSSRDQDKRCPKPKPLDEICAEIECPKMEKLDISGCGFEARKIFAANWTQTPIDIKHMDGGIKKAFWRLFKYISGANDQGVKIAMTVPVLYTWMLDENYKLAAGNMHFYLPSEFQGNPPVPTDDDVSVVSWSDAVVYDRAFGGNRKNPRFYAKQFRMLYKALRRKDITIYPYMSVTAGYTRPGHGRQRNEVMFVDNDSM